MRFVVVVLTGAAVVRVWESTFLTELAYLVTALRPGTEVTAYDSDMAAGSRKWSYIVTGKERATCT